MQLLSRVRQIYGVELSLEVVYSGDFTVAELAKAVELKEIEQSGADYQDLLQELERLTIQSDFDAALAELAGLQVGLERAESKRHTNAWSRRVYHRRSGQKEVRQKPLDPERIEAEVSGKSK